jgi:hypothetical protein
MSARYVLEPDAIGCIRLRLIRSGDRIILRGGKRAFHFQLARRIDREAGIIHSKVSNDHGIAVNGGDGAQVDVDVEGHRWAVDGLQRLAAALQVEADSASAFPGWIGRSADHRHGPIGWKVR